MSISVPGLLARLRAGQDQVCRSVADAVERTGNAGPGHRDVTLELVAAVSERCLDGDAGGLQAVGRRYAESGVSHAQAVFELQYAIIELSRQWWARADPMDVGTLLQLGQRMDSDVVPMRSALGEGYCRVLAASGTRAVSRSQLVGLLLAGQAVPRRLPLAAGVDLAAQYVLLTAATGSVPAEDVADAIGVPGALVHLDGARLRILVPATRAELTHPRDAVDRAFSRLSAANGTDVAGAVVAPIAELPEAAARSADIAEIGARCGRRGPILAEQVLVERALAGREEALGELAAVIGSLARWPYLPDTLSVLYDHDLDRSATAEALHIARRTLTKRLDRIEQITGIHPTSARGVQTFLSALAVERMRREHTEHAALGAQLGVS